MEGMQFWQNVVLPFAAAGFGGWLTAQLALGRFRKEKIWERKTAAYTALFEALFDMGKWDEVHLDELQGGADVDKTLAAELGKEYRDARIRMRRRITSETWLLPEGCAVIIHKLFRALDQEGESFSGKLIDDSNALDAATVALRVLVRRDLGIE